jgi:hypothetical protein
VLIVIVLLTLAATDALGSDAASPVASGDLLAVGTWGVIVENQGLLGLGLQVERRCPGHRVSSLTPFRRG